ncbi:MAG: type II toxin-antitoxin system HicA family toxin [Prevotellaceae bacterium]|nr:type II toxin-antitoxin system HicA family toxin [Candidatus Minthosoma caballi]
MKTSQFCSFLTANGCFVLRHGKRHDIWTNPKNNATYAIPRHGSQELSKRIVNEAREILGV